MSRSKPNTRRRRLIRGGGFGEGSGGSFLPDIELEWLSDGTDTTPAMQIDVPIGVMIEGDHWEIRFYSDAGLTTQVAIAEGDVSAADESDGEIDDTLSSPLTNGVKYARARIFRGGQPLTDYSNVVSQEITGAGGEEDDDYAAWLAAA